MNRKVHILAWGVAGVVLTGALTAVAVAVAGHDIATPVTPIGLTSNRPEQPGQELSEPREGPTHDQGKGGGEGAQPGDDRGGDATSGSNSAPGSGDSGASDEGSGDSAGDHDGNGGGDDD
jgi:hypothetical protein